MPSIAPEQTRKIVIGVDTHKHVHVAVALDEFGGRVGELTVVAAPDGYRQLEQWSASAGNVAAFGIEGTGSYGMGLARFLRRQGHRVLEVNRPDRRLRRQRGKSDPLDAENAARAVLSGEVNATP